MSPAQKKFSRRMAAKANPNASQPIQGGPITGQAQDQGGESDPHAVLEKHGCSVFLPNKASEALDWDYLAGY